MRVLEENLTKKEDVVYFHNFLPVNSQITTNGQGDLNLAQNGEYAYGVNITRKTFPFFLYLMRIWL